MCWKATNTCKRTFEVRIFYLAFKMIFFVLYDWFLLVIRQTKHFEDATLSFYSVVIVILSAGEVEDPNAETEGELSP